MELKKSISLEVTFSLNGKMIDPDRISAITGAQPSNVHKQGEKHGENMIWKYGFWEISSKNQINSEDLQDHLIWILNQMDLGKSYFQGLMRDDTIFGRIACLYQSKYGHGDFVLSGEVLRRLAEYPLKEFWIDSYFENEEDE